MSFVNTRGEFNVSCAERPTSLYNTADGPLDKRIGEFGMVFDAVRNGRLFPLCAKDRTTQKEYDHHVGEKSHTILRWRKWCVCQNERSCAPSRKIGHEVGIAQ